MNLGKKCSFLFLFTDRSMFFTKIKGFTRLSNEKNFSMMEATEIPIHSYPIKCWSEGNLWPFCWQLESRGDMLSSPGLCSVLDSWACLPDVSKGTELATISPENWVFYLPNLLCVCQSILVSIVTEDYLLHPCECVFTRRTADPGDPGNEENRKTTEYTTEKICMSVQAHLI